jgi:hypothetical protein
MVAAAALQDLPPALAPWFQGLEQELPDHANDPDRWRETDPTEGPRHYLDCEPYGGPASVPLDRNDAVARLGEAAFQADGQVPWTIQDRVAALAEVFRSGDRYRAAFQAAILCHYVADLHVPLHTTVNHDGQDTGQTGVHRRWESGLVERLGDWRPGARPAALGTDPEHAPWRWLRDAYAQVGAVLEADRAASRAGDPRGGPDSGYWRAFQRREGPRVKERLALAAEHTARMILLAWTKAGRPPAPEFRISRPGPAPEGPDPGPGRNPG